MAWIHLEIYELFLSFKDSCCHNWLIYNVKCQFHSVTAIQSLILVYLWWCIMHLWKRRSKYNYFDSCCSCYIIWYTATENDVNWTNYFCLRILNANLVMKNNDFVFSGMLKVETSPQYAIIATGVSICHLTCCSVKEWPTVSGLCFLWS